MNVRARKVARDLFGNPARTALVVAAIAVGLLGLSTTLRARAIFSENLANELAAANPTGAIILTEGADAATAARVAEIDEVADAEGRLVTFARIAVGDGLRPLRLVVRDDLGGPVDRLRPEQGEWPPPPGTLALERSSLDAAQLQVGDVATVVDPAGVSHRLEVASATYDLTVVSGRLVDQVVFGYVDSATWERLGNPAGFNQIAFTVVGGPDDEDLIGAVAEEAAARVAATGRPVFGTVIPPPGKHVLDNVVSSLLLILGALAVLSLLLSGFLVFNTVAATLARQRPQIGIMKAVGASRKDVLTLYLAAVAVYSLLALLVAIPLGALAARMLSTQLGTLLNVDVTSFGAPRWVWLTEIGSGLLVPMVAALAPILGGTAATVAEVIRGGAATAFGTGRIDRLLARLQRLPGSLRYAARNTFRHKVRLALTVLALALGGAILISVLTLRTSLLATVDSVAAYWQQDVTVDLLEPRPRPELERIAAAVEGVADVEGWLVVPASVVRADGRTAGETTYLFGVPPGSSSIEPTLLEGRWLEPGDERAVVVNVDVAANEPDVAVGGTLRLRVRGTDAAFDVVGESTTQLVGPGEPRPATPIVYVPYSAASTAIGAPDAANRLVVTGVAHDAAAQDALAAALEADLTAAGIPIQSIDTRSRMREQVERLTTPILVLLAAMAALFALVGGLGLLGTMSLNVLERTGEFGVVRAVGATGGAVLTIVLVEGLTVAALSWLLGSLLAVPLGWAMAQAVGVSFLKVPLDFRFAPLGVVAWLAMAVVLAAIASWLPARTASRISVRDAIAYE